jgi:CopG family nickel-responsive transcriptional regulator
MSEVVRFSVSLEPELLQAFDRFRESDRDATRSDAVRQLIREKLTSAAWQSNAAHVSATLVLVYDHHKTTLTNRMLDVQHDHGDLVVSSMHVHLDHDLCMEAIALRGPARKVQALAAALSGLKGIHQSQLVIARADDSRRHQTHHHGMGPYKVRSS